MIAASAVGLSVPYLMKVAVDQYVQAGDALGLTWVCALCFLLHAANWIASRLRTYSISWIGENMINTMRTQLFGRLQSLSFSFYDRVDIGDLVSRVTNDTDAVGEAFVSEAVNAFSDMITVTGIVAMMFLMNVKLTLASLAVIPLVALSVRVFQPVFRSAYQAVRTNIAEVTSRLEEALLGIREIQSFVREAEAMKTFKRANGENLKANLHAEKMQSVFFPISNFISQVGRITVLLYGGYLLIQGEVTIGVLVAFLAYLSSFFEPIAELTTLNNTLQSALAASERVFEVIDTLPEVSDRENAKELPEPRGEIVFQNVTFAYDPRHPVLHNVSFRVKRGETLAIVGPTGAGKSTIAKLLLRFYEPQSGSIAIDGIDIRDVRLESLRSHIGIVLQEMYLFSGTIMENIRYGRLDATDEQVMDATRAVGAHDFIEKMPAGYGSWVGERGVRISAGQRQLVSFARALLKDPAILVLDEATSRIDPYTDLKIKVAQSVLLRGRASLVIAHRLSTVVNADKIIVLADGRIVGEGDHRNLLEKSALYRRLYEMQFGDTAETPVRIQR